MKLLFLVLLSSLVTFGWTLEDAPRVKTPLGAIKGYYKISGNGKQYEAYEGIPYALPPVGKFRFKVKSVRLDLIFEIGKII